MSFSEPPEELADIYLDKLDILIELKSIQETELSQKIPKHHYIGSISPFKHGPDSYSSIDNHLKDACKKSNKASLNTKYSDSIFIVLFFVRKGNYNLQLDQLLSALQIKGFINYRFAFSPNHISIIDEEEGCYFLKIGTNSNSRFENIDYIGIIQGGIGFNDWEILLIEKPNYTGRAISMHTHRFTRFLKMYRPSFR